MTRVRILVTLDGSRPSERGVHHAAAVARPFNARVTLLHALDTSGREPDAPGGESTDWRLRRAEMERYLQNLAQQPSLAGLDVDVRVVAGRPAARIIEFLQSNRVDLLVLAAVGRSGETEFPFGGTAHKILTRADVSYLVVREDETSRSEEPVRYRRVLVPLDGSHKAEQAVQVAGRLDPDHDLSLVLLHVVARPSMTRRRPLNSDEQNLCDAFVESNREAAASYIADIDRRLAGQHDVHSRLEVASNPVGCIAAVAREERADLMILTAYGGAELNGWSRLSICQELLARAPMPVLVLQDGQGLGGSMSDLTEAGAADSTSSTH